MEESTIVRNNLMIDKGYSPYCGNDKCKLRMPRSAFDNIEGQFTCACGYSAFPEDFINRYKTKWGL